MAAPLWRHITGTPYCLIMLRCYNISISVSEEEMDSMVRKGIVILLAAVSFCLLSACSADQAKDLFETAQFEELQNNREHAEQLYKEIVSKYPESPYSRKAEERLEEFK